MTELEDDARDVRTRITLRDHVQLCRTLARIDARHAEWSPTVGTISPFPTLPLGPSPTQLLGKAVTGMRFPVTDLPDGTTTTRNSGIGFNHGVFVPLGFDDGAHESVTLVDG